ncbi:MAG: hypothetical protein NC548_59715 [Lachnospiraceae bacterium]|nr:hypothetical protein [Lachnospiraceae bacterium]
MELQHLINLIAELPTNTEMSYVRSNDKCTFLKVDTSEPRVYARTNTNEEKSWAPSFLEEFAPKIKENVPFNTSQLLNNKGSFRPVIDTIIAHTREFYWVKRGTAIETVWIPSKPKETLELQEIDIASIPPSSEVSDASIIINDNLSKDYSISDLASILKSMHSKLGTTGIHLFAIKYGGFFTGKPIKDILSSAGLSENYQTEISKMKGVYNALLANDFDIRFYTSEKSVKSKDLSKSINEHSASFSQYLRAMRTKPFLLLAGISGTGKSRIVKQMAFDSCPDNKRLREDKTSPGNYCLVEVKPNWHDSSELMGYESQIGHPHYVATTFVRFLAKAMLFEEQQVPFFVCLDEMNLAPVEQYFAEFLSVLESRKVVDGKITSEALIPAEIFVKYENQLKEDLFGIEPKELGVVYSSATSDPQPGYGNEEAVYELLKKNGLRIPSNLIVIGTVNMDETTHQFSRKVIDRAMTIEMNLPEGEPFMDFFNNARDLEYTDNPTSHELFLPTLVKAADVVAELEAEDSQKTSDLKSKVATILTELNESLNDTPFKIAYRVQNELMLYFHELWLEDKSRDWNEILRDSVDQILMMKVLPRVEGDEDMLEKPLASLATFCATGIYTNAAKKVEEMQKRLERAHFTSYWP